MFSFQAASADTPESYNSTIQFLEGTNDALIGNHYVPRGVKFLHQEEWDFIGGNIGARCGEQVNAENGCILNTPGRHGPVGFDFVETDGAKRGVRSLAFQLRLGQLDRHADVTVYWYDNSYTLIASKNYVGSTNNGSGKHERVVIAAPKDKVISRVRIISNNSADYDLGAGFMIDDLSYDQPQQPCGDDRDTINDEYDSLKVNLSPLCENYSQSAHNDIYSFDELNSSPYAWALLREPLTRSSSRYGLYLWVALIGDRPNLNSGYRSPKHNQQIGGANKSRHMHGDAADVANRSRTKDEYKQKRDAARLAEADYVEPLDGPCGTACVHADWRYHAGPYTQ